MGGWKYRIIDSRDIPGKGIFQARDREALEDHLNALGAEGWEIISVDWNELEGRTSFLAVAKKPA